MKILIADDEILVRRSIRLFLQDLGVELTDIEEADNGISMVEILRRVHIDLALVDIQMPAMSGLEAVREAREESPYTDFYVLSGFDDFKYAQEAIRLDVCDYILKPLKRTDMEKILEKTISRLEKDKMELIRNLHLSIMSFLSFPENPVSLSRQCYPVLLANDVVAKRLSLSELLERDSDKIIVIPHTQEQHLLLFLFEVPEYPDYHKTYVEHLKNLYLDSYTIVEGRPFFNNEQWNADYRRMKKLALYRPLYGNQRFYKRNCQVPVISQDLEEACLQCEKNIQDYLRDDYIGFSLSNEQLIPLLSKMETAHPAYIYPVLKFLGDAYQISVESVERLKKELLMIASKMMRAPSTKDFKYDEVRSYIHDHYMEDLTLAKMASVYGLSPNYFSTLFKKKAGCNFISYLTRLRIENSKQFLRETDMTIREIAERVGYQSASFFIRTFKNAEGVTPSEYKRSL